MKLTKTPILPNYRVPKIGFFSVIHYFAQLLAVVLFESVSLMRENLRELRENLKHKTRAFGQHCPCSPRGLWPLSAWTPCGRPRPSWRCRRRRRSRWRSDHLAFHLSDLEDHCFAIENPPKPRKKIRQSLEKIVKLFVCLFILLLSEAHLDFSKDSNIWYLSQSK